MTLEWYPHFLGVGMTPLPQISFNFHFDYQFNFGNGHLVLQLVLFPFSIAFRITGSVGESSKILQLLIARMKVAMEPLWA